MTTSGASSAPQLTAVASGQSVVLNWTAPSDTSGLTGYYIYRGASPGGESASPLRDFPVTQTTFTDNPASSGTYYYIVKPVYNSTTPGASSNEASATVTVVSTGGVTIVLQVGQPTMTVNGVTSEIDPGQGTAPVLVDGRVFVPIRSIVQAMGGTIDWSASEQKLTITLGATVIDLWIGRNTARVNGMTRTLDVAPYVSDTDRTMLPLRFVIENLGCQVQWEIATQKVTIIYAGGSAASVPGPGSTNPPATQPTTTTPSTTPPSTVASGSGPFTGLWNVTDAKGEKDYMYLIQNGSQLSGNWDNKHVITGSINAMFSPASIMPTQVRTGPGMSP